MNRGQIRSAVADSLRNSQYVRWSSAELDAYIDDGLRDIGNRTGCFVQTENLQCPAGESFVDLPEACLYPIAFRDVTTGLPVDMCHWSFIDSNDPTWIRRRSSRPQAVAAWGLKKALIYPAYSATSNMEIIYAKSDIDGLSSDSEVPAIPVQHHLGLVHYAHFRALLKDADGPRLGRALRQLGNYEKTVAELEEWSNSRHEGVAQAMYGERFRVPRYSWGWP